MYFKTSNGFNQFDDFYIIDTSTAGHSTFLGPVSIRGIHPNADTSYDDMTPSSGTDHYALVDEECPDTSDYLTSNGTGDTEVWGYGDVPTDTTVKAVEVRTASRTNGVSENFAPICRSGGTNHELTQQTVLSATFDQHTEILETDPDTSTAWTPTTLNAAQFGVKHK